MRRLPRNPAASAGVVAATFGGAVALAALLTAAALTGAALTVAARDASASPADPVRDEPWLDSPLAADPARMLSATAARAATDAEREEGIQLFLEEQRHVFDDKGRRTRVTRRVIKVLKADAVSEVSAVEAFWKPWKDDPPVLKGRVIEPGGKVHLLDPAAVADRPAEADQDVWDDRRIRSAPLPGLSEGAVVEWETVETEKQSFPGGAIGAYMMGYGIPVARIRLVVEAPESMPFTYRAHLLDPSAPKVSKSDGTVVRTWEVVDQKGSDDREMGVPVGTYQRPFVEFATGTSWSDIASWYARVVDDKLQGENLSKLAGAAPKSPLRLVQIDALLSFVQREVRYTGLAFGESAIIPERPGAVCQRKFGDCKDQATLLAGLLRARGIDAHVALLRAGEPHDAAPELPALATFNHAIVYVPGEPAGTPGKPTSAAPLTPPVWIDPTSMFHRAGQLPEQDQDRWALICRKGTTALVKTPQSSAKENLERVQIDIRLAPDGNGSFREESSYAGSFDSYYRGMYDGGDEERRRKGFEGYAERSYGKAVLSRYEITPARDLTKPFRLVLEGTKAQVAQTDDADAIFAYRRASILSNLPGTSDQRRRHDLALIPFRHEIEWRVIPPQGYAPRALPESERTSLGPATLESEIRTATDGTVTIRLVCTLDKRRLTPAEVLALHEAAKGIREEKARLVTFENRAEAALAAGKVKEAIAELKGLETADAKASDPHRRMAKVLLSIGLGEAARREAKRATDLEPGSAKAWHQLGLALQHDAFGRLRRKGWDPAGAEAALRKGVELDAENIAVRAELAILLEFDSEGRRFHDAARLQKALAVYKEVFERKPELSELARGYLVALLQAGRPADVLAFIKDRKDADELVALRITALGMENGAEKALAYARREVNELPRRRQLLEAAASTLMLLRRYEAAASLFTEAGRGGPKAVELGGKADFASRLKRWQRVEPVAGDPVSVVRTFLTMLWDEESVKAGRLQRLLVTTSRNPREDEDPVAELLDSLRRQERSSGLPAAVARDIAFSSPQYSVEGDPEAGWKVKVVNSTLGRGTGESTFWLAKEDGEIRIIGGGDDRPDLARWALSLAARGDLDGARRWLDRIAESPYPQPKDDKPLQSASFPRFWPAPKDADPKEALRLACAAVLADGGLPPDLLETVRAARKRSPDDRHLAVLLFRALRASTAVDPDRKPDKSRSRRPPKGSPLYDEMLALLRPFQEKEPDVEDWDLAAVETLSQMRRRDEAEKLARAHLSRKPQHLSIKRLLASILIDTGKIPAGIQLAEEILKAPDATSLDYNNSAWFRLVAGRLDDETLAQSSQGVEGSRRLSFASLNTHAAVLAELGRSDEAWSVVQEGMELLGADEPTPPDWYVMGRILEGYGLVEDARDAYLKAQSADDDPEDVSSIRGLASRRLKSLTAGGKSRGTAQGAE